MKSKEVQKRIPSILAGLALVVGSYLIILRGSPEFFVLTTENGELHIEGVSINAKELYITSNPIEDSLTVHTIQPEGLARQAELRATNTKEEVELFILDQEYDSWRVLEETWEGRGITQFGTGDALDVEIPNYDQLMEIERSVPPDNAVGYVQYMQYQIDGELIKRLLPQTVRTESCQGAQQRSQRQEESVETKRIKTTVNGEPAEVAIHVVTRWLIDARGRCDLFSTNQ